jgi:FkbM family methyltransferase
MGRSRPEHESRGDTEPLKNGVGVNVNCPVMANLRCHFPNAARFAYAVVIGGGLLAAVACSKKSYDDNFLANEPALYSQGREEVVVRHFFKDRRKGLFLDVGAAEWKTDSTTYYLEKHLGWHGIAIDARGYLAPQYEQNRRNTKFFGYAVTDHSGDTIKFYMPWGAPELSSIYPEHLDLWNLKERVAVDVPTITLNGLLERERVTKIDFMSMDIEESEPAALAGFDIKTYAPELVCIEASPSIRKAITKYFADNGYEQIDAYLKYDQVNWYYHRRV